MATAESGAEGRGFEQEQAEVTEVWKGKRDTFLFVLTLIPLITLVQNSFKKI